MKGFGASAPADRLMAHFGFTVEQVAEAVRGLRSR
jgi:transketolase